MLFVHVSPCSIVSEGIVLDAGAEVDKQDHQQWSALMWATTNSQPQIVRLLLDHGASPTVKTGAGRTALDFVSNHSSNREIESYLRNGNDIGSVGVSDDWYDKGFGGEIEEHFAESERKRRMMMESAFNLEVDISSLALDEPQEVNTPGAWLMVGTRVRRRTTFVRMGKMSP
jgi:ankyrin repeat protein